MKKTTLLILIFVLTLQNSFSQTQFVGSSNYGRLSNFVYDATTPNRLYATTQTKHIMVSNDNGTSWEVLYSIPSQIYDPSLRSMKLINNGSCLSFVEHYGSGSALNKLSVLNLATNTIIKQYSMPVPSEFRNFQAYSIYDDGTLNNVMILASGTTDKVYFSNDGGTTYTTVFDSQNNESVILNDVTIDPSNANKLYIARNGGPGNTDGGLLISNDAGTTWNLTLAGLILQTVRVNPSNSNDIFVGTGVRWGYPGQQEALYRSLDGGLTWNTMPITWNQYSSLGAYSAIFSITFNPNNSSNIVVLEDNQIIRTTDNGVTWQNTIFSGYPDPASFNYYVGKSVAINPTNSNNFFIDNEWYPLKTIDGGATTTIVNNPFFRSSKNLNYVEAQGQQRLFYSVQYGYLNKNLIANTETALETLPIDSFPYSGDGFTLIANKNNAGRVYTYKPGFSGNSLNVSNDGGITENPVFSSYDQLLTAAMTDPNNSNVAYFSTFNGINCTLTKVNFLDFNNPIATNIVLPTSNDYLNSIWIDPSNSNKILITVGSSLYKSLNGGTSWVQITDGLSLLQTPNIGIEIKQNPLNPNQLTMAASNGIYTSLNGGDSWSNIYGSLITKVIHSDKTNGHIVGISSSYLNNVAKIVYSSDSGATWTTINPDQFYNSIVTSGDVKFNTSSAEVYLATTDLGILKINLDFESLSNTGFTDNYSNLVLFPNPTNGVFTVKMTKGKDLKIIEVFSTTGQKIVEVKNSNKVDLSNFSNGIYLIKTTDLNNFVEISKLVKN